MRKTEKIKQQSGAPAARRRGRSKVLAILALAAAVAAALAVGRQLTTMAQSDQSLFNRMERTVKSNEPSWKLVLKDERKGATENKYFTQDWKLGEDEYVSTATYEYADEETAAKTLADFIKSPISSPVSIKKVQGLGDEAYAIGDSPYDKKGAGTLVARRGNIMIRLDSSSLKAAERFARHMLKAVDDK
jgi:hypothetical protein